MNICETNENIENLRKKNRYSKEIEDIKDQMGILELKNIITKIKKLSGWTQQHNGRNKSIS